jgi:hypothetical protein
MKESVCCTEIVNSFIKAGHWAYKIPDPRVFVQNGNPVRHRKRPFDIVAYVGSIGLAIEVKILKKWKKFSPKQIEPHQVIALDKITAQGGYAFIFLNIRISDDDTTENRLIIFDWFVWSQVLTKTGLSKNRLKELPYCQGSKGLFRIDTFLGGIINEGSNVNSE